MSDEKIYNAVELISQAKIRTLKNFFLIGLPTETKEDREALVNMVIEENNIFSKNGVKDSRIKVDVNPFIPKWHTPFKNYVYHYLPEHREDFKQIIVDLYQKFDVMDNIRPKQTPLSYSLAQTWLTHLERPINFILKQVPLKNNVYSTTYAPFFLYRYEDQLDQVLKDQWQHFTQNNWRITHPIKATHHFDEWFTNEFKQVWDYRTLDHI